MAAPVTFGRRAAVSIESEDDDDEQEDEEEEPEEPQRFRGRKAAAGLDD